MFWVDRLVAEILETRKPKNGVSFLVRDEKTMSGRVHVGSMRAFAIHGLVSEALSERDVTNEFRYELNDFDDLDAIPSYLDEASYRVHLGKPLYAVPSPDPAFTNFAEFYASEFISVHEKAGFSPAYYRASELYRSGKMDPFIRIALSRAESVRRILRTVSGSEKDAAWLPISVRCEQCGKLKTTRAYDFDGETVAYACDQEPYGALSCGHSGRVSPFSGNAKLFWKVDWAAKWAAQGVDIEGGGKDHSTKGGSRDVANHIARELFQYEPPFDIPHEFFLIGGKKMSSSKGRGSTAKDMSDLFPPEVFRLLLIGKDIHEQIDIDPSGESVPRLYDWYDELSAHAQEKQEDDYARLFRFCQMPDEREPVRTPWQMRFREVSFITQMPHLTLEKEAAQAKGGMLSPDEREALEERARYARFWLSTYAPESYKYVLQETAPRYAFSDAQKKAFQKLHGYLSSAPHTGEEIHTELHALKDEIPIAPKELFQGIYQAFLGRDSGPKAGWFLGGLSSAFVLRRLAETM